MPHRENDRTAVKKRINYSNSFRNLPGDNLNAPFRREDELRRSTGSVKIQHGVKVKTHAGVSLKYPIKIVAQGGEALHATEAKMVNGQRSGSSESPMSDKEEQNTIHHNVSHLIKGFESKTDKVKSESYSHNESNSFLTPTFGSYEESLECDTAEKHKRSTSKRKLSIRKRGKGNNDVNITVLQKLGIAPFMGSENRNARKALAHFDIQSVIFDIENAPSLKTMYGEGGNRPRNISTGASAASARNQKKKMESGDASKLESRVESIIDDGDGTGNDLVESCPYFRNELGSVQNKVEDRKEKLLSKFNGNVSGRMWASMSKNRTPSLELVHTTDNDIDAVFNGSTEFNDLDQKKNTTILESIEDDSLISLWDRPKNSFEKRIFDFEHVDLGALYYKTYFVPKDHQNYMGIDEKYGPVCISLIRENIEKMAVFGHPKELTKGGTNKYQYRIILRTTDLQTFRGTVLEDSVPSTTRHGSSRALPARDILEFCFPELQISCLKTAIGGPKVPEHLQKLDEQQLSLQFKVGLLYCKAGQKSEEDMYNNEHSGPALDEFMEIIGEKVFLKGFEGYRAQLDNKNDSTGTYSLYTKFQNREIMFHVSTLLPWTPNNRQQLLRKRHIGNDIVTVIFQEPGAEPFTPKNIRSHFQHVFIIVRVENPNSSNTTYRVAVSRSQDVPEFGPPIPPDSVFRNNKAFRDFLLSKVINAENAAHKSEKFTAMAVRTRYEYLKDLATNFVTAQGIDSGGAKFSKFNPMSLSVKKREKVRPPCSPEVWSQAGLVWSVKVDGESVASSSLCFVVISTSVIAFINKVNKEIIAAIPCKSVIGWRNSGYSMRLYYNTGQGLNLTLVEDDGNEMTFVINRLKAVTPGCQTQDMSLRRSANGQLGFHVFYEGLVAEVEPYGMAWQAGLRKGSRLLEINNRLVGRMSHDRMIQALRKPGNTRVVVLPPLPDGQPRNYKSTRNLKRYSSMTSVYSERLPDSTDSSSSSSSLEKIPTDFDVSTPIRVGGQKMTVIEAIVKQTAHLSKSRTNTNHGVRPYGFVLDSDQSLEFTEGSSGEHLFLSSGVSGELGGVNKPDGSRQEKTSKERFHEDALSPNQVDKEKTVDVRTPKVGGGLKDTKRLPTAVSIDPELTELERTITDARKSIDAKFYRSLVQSSISNKTDDQSNHSLESLKSHNNSDKMRRESPVGKLQKQDGKVILEEHGHWQPSTRSASSCSENPSYSKPDLSPSTQSDVSAGSKLSLNRIRSPPPYEEAINSLERNRNKKPVSTERGNKLVVNGEKDMVTKQENKTTRKSSQTSESNMGEKPRYLTRNLSADRRKYRSQVKSENLEDLLGQKAHQDGSLKHEHYTPPYEFIGNRNKLMIARSESNIPFSCKQFSTASDTDERHRSVNVVQTRVRDVNDVINEKIHVRSGSADQLSGFNTFFTTPQRSSSVDENQKSEYEKAVPRTSVGDISKGLPYSSHDKRKLRNQDGVPDVGGNDLHFIGDHPPRGEVYPITTPVVNRLTEDESLNDTFAKIDQAFGFTSYVTEKNHHDVNEEKQKRTKHRQKSAFSAHASDNSDGDSTNSALGIRMGGKLEGLRQRSLDNGGPQLPDSFEKKKSEAEESLEAAITEFHSTLFSLPEKNSAQTYGRSVDSSHTPRSDCFSDIAYTTSKGKFDKSGRRLNESLPYKLRNDGSESPRSAIQISRKTITYPDEKSNVHAKGASRQRLDSPSHAYKGSGGRVQELVGKFSQQYERKNSLDSSIARKSDRARSRSEARISLLASPTPWVRKSSNPTGFKVSEASSIIRRYEKHRESHTEKVKQEVEKQGSETPVRKKISVTVRPKLEMESTDQMHIAPNSPSWNDACERGMATLPGRGKKYQNAFNKSVVDVPLSVRGLDLAPSRAEDLSTSSKEDLRLMLSVLSGELIKEKSENERLLEELELARIEKEELLKQAKRSASQLRKFTSWLYDSVSNKDATTID